MKTYKNIKLKDSGKIIDGAFPQNVRIWHRFIGQPNECYTVSINNTIQDNHKELKAAEGHFDRLVADYKQAAKRMEKRA